MDERDFEEQPRVERPVDGRLWADGRIEIVREIGSGGMGVVYEAIDRARSSRVAVKTLHRLDAHALGLFKREFRVLTDIHHENLVQYGELFEENGVWFFTMELLSGVDLFEWVCASRRRPSDASGRNAIARGPEPASSDVKPREACAARAPTPRDERSVADHAFDETRLREALRQLAAGLAAIHAARKVHRDIKPSNVLVERDGHVVILDFGLVADARSGDESNAIVGTAQFMAPEQALGEPVGPAADCYALGSTLYLLLTGRAPYLGSDVDVLGAKVLGPPERPSAINPRVPADLDALCADLLAAAREARPTAAEIVRRLGGDGPSAISDAAALRDGAFIGRSREVAALRAAFDESRRGEAAVCFVHGVSGVGKTAVVGEFLRDLAATDPQAITLRGRCYEREIVPYKTVDEVIDALAEHLAALPIEEAKALAPPDLAPLARVFPALTAVPAFAASIEAAPQATIAAAQQQQMRGRVFGAMRALIGAVARRRPLVVSIDDMQWADADGLALLAEVLRAPDPPPLLLVGTVRTSEDAAHRTVAQLSERLAKTAREVRVEPLSPEESIALAHVLAGQVGLGHAVSAESIAAEAAGHPLFIAELVRHRAKSRAGAVHLDDVIWSRASALEGAARALLDVVAIAGIPLRQDIAAEVVGIDSAQLMKVAAVLRASHLVRTSGSRVEDTIEPYHDRVRETVVARSDEEEKRAWHRRLAESLEAHGRGDSEVLAVHWEAAGDRAKALGHVLAAAEHATRVLAFDRAAQHYARAMALVEGDEEKARALRHKHAEALSNAGRCAEAAADFSELAVRGPSDEAQEMNRRAALEYFKSGHVDEGLDRVRHVLADFGMRLAPNLVLALVSLLLRRAYLRLRGFRFTPRRPEDIPAALRVRIDVTWTVSLGLMTIELFHAADFLTRNVILALASGDRFRITRALGMMTGQISIEGSRSRKRTEELVALCYSLSEEQVPYARAWAYAGDGCAEYSIGQWAKSRELTERAVHVFNTESGSSFEKNNLLMFNLWTLYYLGEIRELSTRVRALLEDARQRGDQFFEHYLRTGFPLMTWLAADAPGEARTGLEAMLRRWSRRGFHAQHWWGLTGSMLSELYEGAPHEAYARLCREWGPLQRSLLPRMQNVRIEAWDMRARGALAVAPSVESPEPLIRAAARDAQRIERERMPWATPLAQAIRAAVDWHRGARERALEQLAEAERGFRAADMGLFAAAAQRRRGELVEGDEGRALIDGADAWMRGQGIERPASMTNVFAPRFWSPSAGRGSVRRDG